jgi:hypothetical protein
MINWLVRKCDWWIVRRWRKPVFPYWFQILFASPGNCKSLEQARLSDKLFSEYHWTEKRFPELPTRILYSTQLLLNDRAKEEWNHGHYLFIEEPDEVRYCPRKNCWKGLNSHENHDIDIMIDEGALWFPAKEVLRTPQWLIEMWTLHRHRGIRILMCTQDYAGIDLNVRRMAGAGYYMHKVRGSRDISPTLPPLSRWTILNFLNPRRSVVWGYYKKRRIDPMVLKHDPVAVMSISLDEKRLEDLSNLRLIGRATTHFITWYKISLYDTTQDITEYDKKLYKMRFV